MYWLWYLVPVPVLALSLLMGPAGGVSFADVAGWFFERAGGFPTPALADGAGRDLVGAVLLDVRLPRALLAFLVGAGLTVSGAALQAVARNPLVSPDILGLSAGAACGAALALTTPGLPLQPTAFALGLAAAGLSYALAATRRGVSPVSLVLAGVVVAGVFTALLTAVQITADPFKLQTIVHWTMGNLHNASWAKVHSAAPPVILGVLALVVLRWRLNVVALGDEETRAVGLTPGREKLSVLVPAALAATGATAVAGVIALVGLAVPHMARLLVGADNRRLIPVSAVFGGSFLVLVDTAARSVTAFEVPVGLFTTLIGGPFFLCLLRRSAAQYFGE
jgi:iron complex transport system permease protein